jgi:riboflavin kinase/FMN adenylyltransferase
VRHAMAGGKMLVEEELTAIKPEGDTALTVGVFDGVHRGHQSLIARLNQKAAAEGLVSTVVTFKHHPRLVLKPQSHITRLTSLQERITLLERVGVRYVVPLSFTPDLSQLGAGEFVALLSRHLRMRALLIGPDFALGKGKRGDAEALAALGEELNFTVEVAPPMVLNGEVVSSTAIRNALAKGDIGKANAFLGRHFSLTGQVSRGDSRGKTLGFPTANIVPQHGQALPADGVYAVRVYVGDTAYNAVANIGLRPTFGSEERLLETYLLDFNGDLYGQEIRVEFIDRLRDEIRFPDAEELKIQMARDVEQAGELLGQS